MTKTYTQADIDAAVAAVVEKAADAIKAYEASRRDSVYGPWESGYVVGLSAASERVRALIPTDALAELDAKVRADALRDARGTISGTVFALPNGTNMDRSYNLAVKDCLAAIEALIEGEA